MGNQNWCTQETRDFRASTVITTEYEIPVVRGSFDFTNQSTFKKIEEASLKFCHQRNIDNHYIPTVSRIIAYRHDNLFEAYRRLPPQQRQQFMDDLTYLDIEFMDSLYFNLIKLKKGGSTIKKTPELVEYLNFSKQPEHIISKHINTGIKLIKQSKVGVVMMCAGSSSRFLGQDKFLCPLQIPSKKCSLELMFDRLAKNLSIKSKLQLPIFMMCNENNRVKIQKFLKHSNYFGFQRSKFRFILSKNLPILDSNGKFCLSFQYKILNKPSGTAECVEGILNQNTYNFLKAEGVKYVHFCGAQNLKENPADHFLLGLMHNQKRSACAKCVLPQYQTEIFNRYVLHKGQIHLIDVDSLSNFNKSKLLLQSPIAMNSILLDIDSLKEMVIDFNKNMFLSKKYRISELQTDYFDFLNQKPALKQLCYSFEKDISDLLTCCINPLLVLYPRGEYIPLISKQDQYTLKSASAKYLQKMGQQEE